MNTLLIRVANFSGTMLWVTGFLLAANLVALMIVVVRRGKVDNDEGCVLNEQGPLTGNALNEMCGGIHVVGGGGRYVAKEKILVRRSGFISDESLVDGTATKSERLMVQGIRLFFVLFWLLFVFIGLSLLSSEPVVGAIFVIAPTISFAKAALMMRKGRQDALRKLSRAGSGDSSFGK
jgi:hypothetical protein